MLFLGQHRPLPLLLNREISELQHPSKWTLPGGDCSSPAATDMLLFLPLLNHHHPWHTPYLYSPRGSHRLWHFKNAFKWNTSVSWCVFFFLSGETLSSLRAHKSPSSLKDKSQCLRRLWCGPVAFGRAVGTGRQPVSHTTGISCHLWNLFPIAFANSWRFVF